MRLISLLLASYCAIISEFAQSASDLHPNDANILAANAIPDDMAILANSHVTFSGVYIIREDIHLQHANTPYMPLRDSLYSKIFSRSIKSYRLNEGSLTSLSSDQAIRAFEIQQGYNGNETPVPWPSSAVSILSIVHKVALNADGKTYDKRILGISLIVGGEHSLDGMDTYMVTVKYEHIKDEIVAEWVHPLNDQTKMPALEAVEKNFLSVHSVSASNFKGDQLYLPDIRDSTLRLYQSHILFPFLKEYSSYAIPKIGAHEVNKTFTILRQITAGDAGNEMLTDIELNNALSAYLKAETTLQIPNDSAVLQDFSITETLRIKNGKPGFFTPRELSWRNPWSQPCRLALDNPVFYEGKLIKLKRWIMDRNYTVNASSVVDSYGQPVAIPEKENRNKHFIPRPLY